MITVSPQCGQLTSASLSQVPPSSSVSVIARPDPALDQIPAVAVEVLEDHDGAVRLPSGCLDESDPTSGQPLVVPLEVVRLEEQEDTAAGLIADPGHLLRRSGTGEEQARSRPRRQAARPNPHPPLAG